MNAYEQLFTKGNFDIDNNNKEEEEEEKAAAMTTVVLLSAAVYESYLCSTSLPILGIFFFIGHFGGQEVEA